MGSIQRVRIWDLTLRDFGSDDPNFGVSNLNIHGSHSCPETQPFLNYDATQLEMTPDYYNWNPEGIIDSGGTPEQLDGPTVPNYDELHGHFIGKPNYDTIPDSQLDTCDTEIYWWYGSENWMEGQITDHHNVPLDLLPPFEPIVDQL